MSNCIIKIPIKKEALKLAVSAQRQRWRRRCRRLRRLHWAEVNRKITVEHDKRQCYQRNLINTAPRHSTPPTCSSLSHSTPFPYFALFLALSPHSLRTASTQHYCKIPRAKIARVMPMKTKPAKEFNKNTHSLTGGPQWEQRERLIDAL